MPASKALPSARESPSVRLRTAVVSSSTLSPEGSPQSCDLTCDASRMPLSEEARLSQVERRILYPSPVEGLRFAQTQAIRGSVS